MTQLVTYVGNSPAAITSFEKWLGRDVDGIQSFTGDKDWTDWNGSIRWAAGLWKPADREVFWSIPIIPKGATLAEAAKGTYDANYVQAAKQLAMSFPDQAEIHIRTGWEFNGDWMNWAAKGKEADFIGAYRDFVTAFRSVSDKFVFEWTPGLGNKGMNPEAAYPGDKYVDIIGMDFYYDTDWNTSDPVKAFNQKVTQQYGLQWQADFAAAHGKQMAIAEWGVESDNAGPYIKLAADWFANHDYVYQSYWNSNTAFQGKLSDGQYANAGAAYRDSFDYVTTQVNGSAKGDVLQSTTDHNIFAGGLGDDVYVVKHLADEVVEKAGEGSDTVMASVSFTLPDNVEKLILQGTGALDGTGNALANALTGNAGANHLDGRAGNDVLDGGAGNDWLQGGDGSDSLTGGTGDDTLDGGTGDDVLTGGTGNDTYVIDSANDRVVELWGAGTDTLQSYISKSLPGTIENLTLLGTAAKGWGNDTGNVITANASDNQLFGYGGDDTIFGGDGNDSLTGGQGRDLLTGGAGADRFIFDDADVSAVRASYDRITDFSHAQGDRIDLSPIDAKVGTGDNAFTFIGSAAFTAAGQLRMEHIDGDTIITGNTSGTSGAEFGIVLTGNFNLTASDFIL